jgi:4-hydroxyproline epimerase
MDTTQRAEQCHLSENMNPQSSWTIPERVTVVDSHTGGEPTRVIISGQPPLGGGTMLERREVFRQHYDHFRSGVINEPRGSDVWVGAILEQPLHAESLTGVIFFNNASYLGMCGHGTIGLLVTLHALGRASLGTHQLETPVGNIQATLHDAQTVSLANVPSYRLHKQVSVTVPDYGTLSGDVAFGGNWFFLVESSPIPVVWENLEALDRLAKSIRRALWDAGIRGADGAEIDHVELFGPAADIGADSRNYVLCPGGAYDRSPCGTGTSAKLACLAADGKLAPGQIWRQASIIGSQFEAQYQWQGDRIVPTIKGTAYVTAETVLRFQSSDPLIEGIRS